VALDVEAGFTAVEKVVHDGDTEESDTGRIVNTGSELVAEGDCT
jgi:acyl-coenzyme A thioesterase PaaI-like protein